MKVQGQGASIIQGYATLALVVRFGKVGSPEEALFSMKEELRL